MKQFLLHTAGKKIFPFVMILLVAISAKAQYVMLGNDNVYVEAGLNFGPTFFLGDLGGKVGKGTTFIKDLNYQYTKFMKGVFVTVYPSDYLGIRLAGQYTYLEGDDNVINTNGVDELWRKQRNLNFKTNVWEAYLAAEFFPIDYIKRNNEEYSARLRPYVFGGVGVYNFNPQGSLTDQAGNVTWHELQPLHTEGQGFPEYPEKKAYNLTQINIPYGAGLKYMVSDNLNVSTELLYRKTFTDYIDDVSTTYADPVVFDRYLSEADAQLARLISDKTIGIVTPGVTRYSPGTQRGNPKQDDAYFSFVLKIGFRLGGGNGIGGGGGYKSSSDRGAARQARCPVRF